MNKVILTGRITKDPEIKYTSNGVAYVFFSLAVSRNYADRDGSRVTDFINCVVWRQQAEFLSRYIKKGNMLLIEGRVTTRSYKTMTSETRYITEVTVDQIESLTPRERQDGVADYQEPTYNQVDYNKQSYSNIDAGLSEPYMSSNIDIDEDEDLPF